MRIYDLSCEQCGWKAPLPVEEAIARNYRGKNCLDCTAAGRPHPFTVKERIVVGPTQFFPARRKGDFFK